MKVILGQVVAQAARGRDDQLRAHAADDAVLFHGRTASITTDGAQRRPQAAEHIVDLYGKFSRRHHDDSLQDVRLGVELPAKRQQVSQSLPAARRGQEHDIIAPLAGFDRGLLHRTEPRDALAGKRITQLGCQEYARRGFFRCV